ncbi:hypothetical protein [Pseudomonas syringae]|uniref:hypothetical protein n=1 Tax=Pseudomonas syringae TaxID=317 RepID=UPI00215628AE|nr:hypothetical protein [Pseudomonas syringae]
MSKQRDLNQRQILSFIGNRYVVFGPADGSGSDLMFSPDTDAHVIPRIANENEFDPSRLIDSLKIHGFVRGAVHESNDSMADLMLFDEQGGELYVEVKIRANNPKGRDLVAGFKQIQQGQSEGKDVEIWNFNVEKLGLEIQARDGDVLVRHKLFPINIWEVTERGIFARDQVVSRVEGWVQSITAFYNVVVEWFSEIPSVSFETSRTVSMSEELMQKFAVGDKELPILDVISGGKVLASFVPRGLWVIGALGRIDAITPIQTRIIVLRPNEDQPPEWNLVSSESRQKTELLTKEVMMRLLEVA